MIKAIGMFLLMLLKIAGWTLLILLIILLAALLLILFVPVHYDVLAKNERSMESKQKNPAAASGVYIHAVWTGWAIQSHSGSRDRYSKISGKTRRKKRES